MNFKKGLLTIITSVLIVLVSLLLIIYSLINVNLNDLSGKGVLQDTFISPDGGHKAELFIIFGGATVADQERISITSFKKENQQMIDQTIYWMYPAEAGDETQVEWKSTYLIEVNGKLINISDKDTYYNWKKDKEL